MSSISPIRFPKPDLVEVLDQRLLPHEETYIPCRNGEEMARAIEDMVLRGAPLIGIAAAMGVALEMQALPWQAHNEAMQPFERICERLMNTRPTAVNLAWALERMRRLFASQSAWQRQDLCEALRQESLDIMAEDIEMNLAMGRLGAKLIQADSTILTHCNAGALATGGYGTALGVIRSAAADGKNIRVLVDETRPYLQGARLTAWELVKEGIDATLITDSMAAHCMQKGMVQAVVVGADRIAMNGDVANKIGTYALSILAREHSIPFYVAAPTSTIDPHCASGELIPIEQRSAAEVTHLAGQSIAPKDMAVFNPAFDVTPAKNISAIITDKCVLEAPYGTSLAKLMQTSA